ncbi:hypothetical protein A6R68_19393, partial [Neotoma lepida]
MQDSVDPETVENTTGGAVHITERLIISVVQTLKTKIFYLKSAARKDPAIRSGSEPFIRVTTRHAAQALFRDRVFNHPLDGESFQGSEPSLMNPRGKPEQGIVARGVMILNTALQEVRKAVLIHHDLVHEIPKVAKALDKCQLHLCVVASNRNEPVYAKLMTTRNKSNEEASVKLTEKGKKPSKVVGCDCYGKESRAEDVTK